MVFFSVKPNFRLDVRQLIKERNDFFVFIGRLSEQKGISGLKETFYNNGKEP